jgi:hypothetical protein
MSGHIDPHSPLIPAQEMVLPTLQGDGKRRWINPALATGKYWQRRRLLAYGLIAFFVTLPHLRLWGKPIVLLDIVSREFTFFGHTFYPTDSGLLLLLLLTHGSWWSIVVWVGMSADGLFGVSVPTD